MISDEEKQEIYGKLKDFRSEISRLKNELNQVNDEKEAWFAKKQEYGKQIKTLISDITASRKKRDELTRNVKELKKERGQVAEGIKKSIEEVKKVNAEKDKAAQDQQARVNPKRLMEDIEKLEMQIETNVMSFDKEKKLMKEIKSMKKQLGEAKGASNIWQKSRDLSKTINEMKKKADAVHNQIQTMAKQSQVLHEELITKSKEVDELKKKEEEAYKKFSELKEKFNSVNEQLKKKLEEAGMAHEKVKEAKEDSFKEKKKRETATLKDKQDAINEKIARGEKLTTEDLLVLQSFDDEGN
ncbi:hypothetical protein JW968_00670 [Candidatus Woesearchaeota archaeon]|nr:hypothetical protein [Candidatus Woesearchaeota archaeon]